MLPLFVKQWATSCDTSLSIQGESCHYCLRRWISVPSRVFQQTFPRINIECRQATKSGEILSQVGWVWIAVGGRFPRERHVLQFQRSQTRRYLFYRRHTRSPIVTSQSPWDVRNVCNMSQPFGLRQVLYMRLWLTTSFLTFACIFVINCRIITMFRNSSWMLY